MRLSEVTVSAVTPKAAAFFDISSISGFSLQQDHNCPSGNYTGQTSTFKNCALHPDLGVLGRTGDASRNGHMPSGRQERMQEQVWPGFSHCWLALHEVLYRVWFDGALHCHAVL